jgi:hypothetical protein
MLNAEITTLTKFQEISPLNARKYEQLQKKEFDPDVLLQEGSMERSSHRSSPDTVSATMNASFMVQRCERHRDPSRLHFMAVAGIKSSTQHIDQSRIWPLQVLCPVCWQMSPKNHRKDTKEPK